VFDSIYNKVRFLEEGKEYFFISKWQNHLNYTAVNICRKKMIVNCFDEKHEKVMGLRLLRNIKEHTLQNYNFTSKEKREKNT
jgi:hypothetical protein